MDLNLGFVVSLSFFSSVPTNLQLVCTISNNSSRVNPICTLLCASEVFWDAAQQILTLSNWKACSRLQGSSFSSSFGVVVVCADPMMEIDGTHFSEQSKWKNHDRIDVRVLSFVDIKNCLVCQRLSPTTFISRNETSEDRFQQTSTWSHKNLFSVEIISH